MSSFPRAPGRRRWLVILAGATCLAAAGFGTMRWFAASRDAPRVVHPAARGQTAGIARPGEADDPAIWLHPTDPSLSLVLGTDKHGGLHLFNLDGSRHGVVAEGACPNNVAVLPRVRLAGADVDLVIASCWGDGRLGVKVWAVDPATRTLRDAVRGGGGALPVFRNGKPFGICGYRSRRDGRAYFFVTARQGGVEQHRIVDAGDGHVTGECVRRFALPSHAEGCVADDDLARVYLAEERGGIWRFDAEPDGPTTGVLVARVGEFGLTAEIEGLALYAGPGGQGYLLASSQGDSSFKVYARVDNRYLMTIKPRNDASGVPSGTDGIDVTAAPLPPLYPRGLFVAQDDNPGRPQSFKLYAWEDVAGEVLERAARR